MRSRAAPYAAECFSLRLLRLLSLLYEKLDFIVVCDDVVPCAARGILDVDEESWCESFDMVLKRSYICEHTRSDLIIRNDTGPSSW